MRLAAAQRKAGDKESSYETALSWLKEHPEDTAVRTALAGTYLADNQKDEAIKEYEKILNQQPKNVIALNNLAWFYHEQGDRRALDLAKRAHDIAPKSAEIQDTYGWLLVQEGQVERGLVLLEKAQEQAPKNLDIRFHRAAALAKAGEQAEAEKELQEMLKSTDEFGEREKAEALLKELSK
jgi:Tfp pilus assembly protein PilF